MRDLKEYNLILLRCGFLPEIEKFKYFKFCGNHRDKLGMYVIINFEL